MRDLTLLVHELRSTLGKMEQVLSTVDEAIVWITETGRIFWCNAAFDRLVQRPHILNLGSALLQRLPLLEVDQSTPVTAHPAALALEPESKGNAVYAFQQNECILFLEITWSYYQADQHSANGQPSAVLVIRDVTDRQLYEMQLQQTNADLARAVRLKDEFLAIMSHELRTPLNTILGMTEGLKAQGAGMSEKQQRALQTIQQSGMHLLELINDVLDLAKIQAGEITPNFTPSMIDQLCQSSLRMIHPLALQKQMQLQVQIEPNLPLVMLDERCIQKALVNLLNNAVKFTLAGGRITLKVERINTPEHPTVPAWLRIAVSDTGIGIMPENIKVLFQPFVQIDSALNRQYAGTGLGLALVKRIVDLHHGKVGVVSEVGVGSCFTIELPCNLNAPAASTIMIGDLSMVTPRSNSKSPPMDLPPVDWTLQSASPAPLLLFAEENEASIRSVSSYLEAKGYRLLFARTIGDAIELAKTHQPDLMVVERPMFGADLEVMQQIRLDPELSRIPVVVLATIAQAGDREQCLIAGASEYLAKPLKLKQLETTIRQCLGARI
jgi:signal transduction histidine kinase